MKDVQKKCKKYAGLNWPGLKGVTFLAKYAPVYMLAQGFPFKKENRETQRYWNVSRDLNSTSVILWDVWH